MGRPVREPASYADPLRWSRGFGREGTGGGPGRPTEAGEVPDGLHCWLEADGWSVDGSNGRINVVPATDYVAHQGVETSSRMSAAGHTRCQNRRAEALHAARSAGPVDPRSSQHAGCDHGQGGVGFRSLGDGWADTTTPHGRLLLTVLGGLAEFERDLIRTRTGDGRARAKARGRQARPSTDTHAASETRGDRTTRQW